MRPLGELDAATARGLRGLFCDIDDTLTTRGHVVPEAYAAICRLVDAGLRVTLVTGRPAGWGEVLAHLWPVEAVVTEGGGATALPGGEWLWWDDAPTRAAQKSRREALIADVRAKMPSVELARDSELRRVDVAFDIHEHRRLSTVEVDELAAIIRAHGMRAVRSSVHMHGVQSDYDKARMSVRVASRWGETEETLRASYLFVGDSPNDQAGFAFFPISVGVANVRRWVGELAPAPVYVTAAEGGRGFAELAQHLLDARA